MSQFDSLFSDPYVALGYGILSNPQNPMMGAASGMKMAEESRRQSERDALEEMLMKAKLEGLNKPQPQHKFNPVTGESVIIDKRTGLPMTGMGEYTAPAGMPEESGFDMPAAPGGISPRTRQLWDEEGIKAEFDKRRKQEEDRRALENELPKNLDRANYLTSVLDRLQTHPGMESAVGNKIFEADYALGLKDAPIAGTKSADFEELLKQAQGDVFLQAYQELRGGGAITGIEGEKAEAAKARMSTAQSEEAFLGALEEFKGIVEQGVQRQLNKANQLGIDTSTYGAPSQQGYSIGQIINVGGKQYRVVGGDPSDPDVELVR